MSVVLALLLSGAQGLEPVEVEGQPLSVNAGRVVEAMEYLGRPLSADTAKAISTAKQDAAAIQGALDPHVSFVVRLEPAATTLKGPATVSYQQSGWTPVLVKVVNSASVKKKLRIFSPQGGPVYSGGFANPKGGKGRFLEVEMFQSRPLAARLSGVKCEYAIALVYSSEAGKRNVQIGFEAGKLLDVTLDIRPGIPVTLSIRDVDGAPTAGRFTFTDRLGHVYPPQPKRLAPDFFFQKQIYRHDAGKVLLPPGTLSMTFGRGPEYRLLSRKVEIPARGEKKLNVELDRWVNPMDYGFYSGDHHIHASGCAHYTEPTVGVHAPDMFLHVKGEGLNVGCNLTWGPGFEYQRQFFSAEADKVSEAMTVLKYDIEVSGFGSQRLGHVCLLNLKEQYYPGSEGTKTKGWPTWTTPLMKWAKGQGAVTGYAHSANGLRTIAANSAGRLLAQYDGNKDGRLAPAEASGLLPEPFPEIDEDDNGSLSEKELVRSVARASRQIPNYAIPEMNGIGAQEICVTVAQGICDFISAMDTDRLPEWNCWYHLMNCGFPLKVSGETDFPCITGSRVGEGRVYVQLGKIDRIVYADWCKALAEGRSYVSDGYAHALEFAVNGKRPGESVALDGPGPVTVSARVAFGAQSPLGSAPGGFIPRGKTRKVELIVNGQVVGVRDVLADDKEHELSFDVSLDRSAWVALRQFPQLHTNPVNVLVGGKPIRASRRSALWCIGVIEQLWRVRARAISDAERPEAEKTFKWAIEQYRIIAAECPEGS